MQSQNITMNTGIKFIDNVLSGVLTNIVIAVIILLMGFIIGRVVNALLKKFLKNLGIDKILRKRLKIKISLENIITSSITLIIYLISVIMALNQLGITTLLLNIISIAIIALLTFSAVLALKDFIPNLVAGIKIASKNKIKKGDKIQFDKIKAVVNDVTLTETKLKSKSGDIIFIPNSLVLKKIVKVKKRKNS
jgi:small-conductance mechanosensitive channel